MRTISQLVLWLEMRDVRVWETFGRYWRVTIPAIAAVATGCRRLGLRSAAWHIAAFGWNVWDHAPLDDSTKAYHATYRCMPWSGGCDCAWQVAAGVPEETVGRHLPVHYQFDE